ncbi:MAG: YgiQ family radical SAM protein, partial [Clostridia bacterium]|nr:YgiQ family radical SAM protein [Clostridia bacterium]
MNTQFLPTTTEELRRRGWDTYDFLYISGDAYVDHPTFGHAIITRVLEAAGYRVAVLAQPDWRSAENFKVLGRPQLGVLISSGNIDSMVNAYTAAKKPRREDFYSPGGKAGMRPPRAVNVYGNRVREAFGDIPVIIGGIEASLRRFAHYDYWGDKVRRSVLLDAQADLLIYGMGEKAILQIADALRDGTPVSEITEVRGTAYYTKTPPEGELLPSFEAVSESKKEYARSVQIQYQNIDAISGKRLIQPHKNGYLVQNPPMPPLEQEELDAVYALPYTRTWHPSYDKAGGVPALSEVAFSLTSNRGCFGCCSFCALAFHQGRSVRSRSHESLIEEAKLLTELPDFKGYIHDVGGPTANFRYPACEKQIKDGVCANRKCLVPTPCKNLIADHSEYIELLNKIQALPKVKKVFIRSGIRFDYMLADKDDTFFRKLVSEHVSGQLKVAPEHCSSNVLKYMGKPDIATYDKFYKKYFDLCREFNLEQYLVPYLMSSHPGSTVNDAVELSLYLKNMGCNPEQVQDFYPTPGTASTVMYYTGISP